MEKVIRVSDHERGVIRRPVKTTDPGTTPNPSP
jgi:hypothetical protein